MRQVVKVQAPHMLDFQEIHTHHLLEILPHTMMQTPRLEELRESHTGLLLGQLPHRTAQQSLGETHTGPLLPPHKLPLNVGPVAFAVVQACAMVCGMKVWLCNEAVVCGLAYNEVLACTEALAYTGAWAWVYIGAWAYSEAWAYTGAWACSGACVRGLV